MTADAATEAVPKTEVPETKEAKTDGTNSGSLAAPKAPVPGRARPVMIHRAIIGSFERFIAILTEHFAGKWPFWLSPRQILVIPVMTGANDYVVEVQKLFKGMHVDIDISGKTMQKKIREGQLAQYNFIFGKFVAMSLIFRPLTLHSRGRTRERGTYSQYSE